MREATSIRSQSHYGTLAAGAATDAVRTSAPTIADFEPPSRSELLDVFVKKYGELHEAGSAPTRRRRFGYYHPADVYEALVARLVRPGCSWIDIGGGHDIFPDNPALARDLVTRCSRVVAVDPSENVMDNRYVHERVQCVIEDYTPSQQFDIATFRMVVEHIEEPEKVIGALDRLIRPGGLVVLLTVNSCSPLTLVSRLTPFAWHGPIKRVFWAGEDKDGFPVQYKMNSRRVLKKLFESGSFQEVGFSHLDDLSTCAGFRYLNYAEMIAWLGFQRLGLTYPENCLLGVYRKNQ